MELAQVLMVLWRRRGWVALGAVIAVVVALSTSYSLPSLKPKHLSIATADTQLLVDTPHSSLLNASADETPLVTRAAVLAPLMTSLPARQAIAAAAGVPVSAIFTQSPLNPDGDIFSKEPSAAQRSQSLLGQNLGLRLDVQANNGEPTIAITAQAGTVRDALRLANAAAQGFATFIAQSETAQRVPAVDRTILRQLGQAEGGTIGSGVNIELVIVVFFAVLLVWMVFVVVGNGVARDLREIRGTAEPSPESGA